MAVDTAGNVVTATDPTGGAGAWTTAFIDGKPELSPPGPEGPSFFRLDAVSCPTTSLCVAVDSVGDVVTSTDPTGGSHAWKVTNVDGSVPLTGVSCASVSLCVATGGGDVVTSTDPAGGAGAWTVAFVSAGPAISCPSVSLCVSAGGGDVVTSTDPTGGPSAWTSATVENPPQPLRGDQPVAGTPVGLDSISCPSTSLCVAGDYGGNVITSTDPTGGSGAWSVQPLADNETLFDLSCLSVSLCIGTDNGQVITSTNPTGGEGAWNAADLESSENGLDAVSCASPSLCVMGNHAGGILTSTSPTGGAAAWTAAEADGINPLADISCPSVSLCVAVGGANVVTSSNPNDDSAAWKTTRVDTTTDFGSFTLSPAIIVGLSCPTIRLCVAIDDAGNVITSTNLTGGRSAWRVAHVDHASTSALSGVSCASAKLCVAIDSYTGDVLTSTNPAAGKRTWSETHPINTAPDSLSAISCPSVSLCVATDGENVATSTRPSSDTWSTAPISNAEQLGKVSCPSIALCVATIGATGIATTTRPALGSSAAWKITPVLTFNGNPLASLSSISCASPSLCLATDGAGGDVFTTTDPTGGPTTWKGTLVDNHDLFGIASISCPTTALCVAVDGQGNAVLGTGRTRTARPRTPCAHLHGPALNRCHARARAHH